MTDVAHIRHLARLARLSLTDEEAAQLAAEADRILALFDELPAAAAADAGAAPESEGRADEARPADAAQVAAILTQAPRKDGRVILVPRGGE